MPEYTVAIDTHGCKLNQADSEALARSFVEMGYSVLDSNAPVDVFILNTCTVTHVADSKARQTLRAAKRRNPNALIIATGCYAERRPGEISYLPEVDLVMGNTQKHLLAKTIHSMCQENLTPCTTGGGVGISSRGIGRTRASIKIQEGCNQVCSYCIVPKVRGRERSIPLDELVETVGMRSAEGYQEVVLTGTQLGSYGFDLPGYPPLATLLRRILDDTEISRVRVSSLQPQEITEELLELWANARLCPHFHIPLQSGSNGVLKRMRRRYTVDSYISTVKRIRTDFPDAAITTDVIVGFPGETEEEFRETLDHCRNLAFAGLHVFPYSIRPGTSAAYLRPTVKENTKSDHVHELLDLARIQGKVFRQKFLGTTRLVLWEKNIQSNEDCTWVGLSDNYLRVYTQTARMLANTLSPTYLDADGDDWLWGRVINQAEA